MFDTGQHAPIASDHEDDDVVVVDSARQEDLTVQVRLRPLGEWHKKFIGGAKTACGEPIDGTVWMREETYRGKLCTRGCFSPHELEEGEKL